MTELYLMEPDEQMEAAVMAYRQEYLDKGEACINGSSSLHGFEMYAEWLRKVRATRDMVATETRVPATTYLCMRRSDNRIVGTIQLRHELNDDLRQRGGHIGYGIRPAERGKGYGTLQLALVLEKARARGLNRVMITCDQDNEASAKVAMKNGGTLFWEGDDEADGMIRVFWITLPASGLDKTEE